MAQDAVPFRRLLAAGSLAESLGVYVGATAIHRALGIGRMLLFLYLLERCAEQMSYWGIGCMIMAVAAPVIGLGANHGLLRYVSLYEARGQLRRFYRALAWPLTAMAVAVAAIAMLAGKPISALALSSGQIGGQVTPEQYGVCMAALANSLLLALFNNMLAFMYALRTYRLASAIEVLFAILFTASAATVLLVVPSAFAALLCHLAVLAVVLAAGAVLLHIAIGRICSTSDSADARAARADDGGLRGGAGGMLAQLLTFGLPALVGNLLWNALTYVSFWIAYRHAGQKPAAVLFAWMSLAQVILFAATAAWSVGFTHVARRWESGRKGEAMLLLETACKALAFVSMTISALLYISAPLWVGLLPAAWRGGVGMLGDLLVFFQVLSNLAILTTLSRLHERPIIIALCALVGGGAIAALAYWWRADGASGAALAAGVGMYLGGLAVTVLYTRLTKVRLTVGVYLVLAMPALFLLPAPMATAGWAGMLLVAALTPLVFDRREKQAMRELAGRALQVARRGLGLPASKTST